MPQKKTYQELKKYIYKYYNKKKREDVEAAVKELSEIYNVKIDVAKIMEMYKSINVKSTRMYIVISSLVYLWLRHYDPVAMKLSDFKIINMGILNNIRSQLVEKGIIKIDYSKEIDSLVTNYLEKIKMVKYKEECMKLYDDLKEKMLVKGKSARVISSAIIYHVLDKHNEKMKTPELLSFFHVCDVSLYSCKREIETIDPITPSS